MLSLVSSERIGSGAVSQMLVEKYGVHILGVDVNSEALSYARNTLSFSQADLLRGDLSQWVSRKSLFDVVVFNPPYVPTDADELERARRERDIAASWAGGERGREVIDRALPDVRSVLVAGGVFYLVLEKLNVVDEVRELAVRCQFTRGDVVGKVVAGREVLYVFKFIAV